MNKRQAKKQFKKLCIKYGPRISDTYTDGRMTKEESRRVRQSLFNIKAVIRVAGFVRKHAPKTKYDLTPEPNPIMDRELHQFMMERAAEDMVLRHLMVEQEHQFNAGICLPNSIMNKNLMTGKTTLLYSEKGVYGIAGKR